MKALSLTQPWAWIILHLGKRIENRSRNLGNYRGPLLLHAAKGMTERYWRSAYDFVAENIDEASARHIPKALVRGAIVGVCEVIHQCDGDGRWSDDGRMPTDFWETQHLWYMGAHAYVLDDARELPEPIPCKGALGFWTPPPEVLSTVRMWMSGGARP